MYCIKTENLQLKLEVVPVESLLQHEEILPRQVARLVYEFKNWTNLQNPIIVDENNIVLDGNHRAHVFRKLKFKYIPVCRVNYFHEKAYLRYWFRLLSNVKNLTVIKEIIQDLGGHFRELGDREAMIDCLESNQLACGLQHQGVFGLISFNDDKVNDAVSAYGILEKIQHRLREKDVELDFVPCRNVYRDDFNHALKKDQVVIWTPRITKEMVVEAAKQRKIFAPKTTRHCIPARPLNVNVPTSWFKESISLKEIDRRFSKFLESKQVKRFGPGQVIDGRYYEEEVFVFFDR